MPLPEGAVRRTQARIGLRAADPAQHATLVGRRLASIEPARTTSRAPLQTVGRRAVIVAVALAGMLAAFFAVRQIGLERSSAALSLRSRRG